MAFQMQAKVAGQIHLSFMTVQLTSVPPSSQYREIITA